jgi:hypothetical protein
MTIDDNKKVDVLLSALEERYSSIHKIRERVQSIGLWALGLLLGAGGWLMQSDIILSTLRKIIAIVIIIGAVSFIRFIYLEDLRKGFNSQQKIAVRLEKALCLYSKGIFDDSDESIYPAKWARAGTEKSDGKFFDSTYGLLYIGVAFILINILLNGCFHH